MSFGACCVNGLVLVHGSSGSGKSSLVYAGVLPQLERRRRRRKLTIKTGTIRPGRSPLRSLAVELARLCASPTKDPDVDAMHRTPDSGTRRARGDRSADPRQRARTRSASSSISSRSCFASPARATRRRRAFLPTWSSVLPDREDDRYRAGTSDGGNEAALRRRRFDTESETARTARWNFRHTHHAIGVSRATARAFLVSPKPSIARNISCPICRVRICCVRSASLPPSMARSVDWDLAEQLAQDAAREADALPLIQHALMRLWEQKSGETLRLADYEAASAMQGGEGQPWRTGMAQILAAHAEEILASSLASDRKDDARVVEHLFRALTDIDTEGRAVRRPQTFATFVPGHRRRRGALRPILDAFRADGVSSSSRHIRAKAHWLRVT